MSPKKSWNHCLALGLGGIAVVVINAGSSDHALRAHDRDVFTLLRSQHPEILRDLDLSSKGLNKNLVGLDLSGVDLRSVHLKGRSLKNMNLKGSQLERAEFNCVLMDNVDFSGANLRGASFKYDTTCAGIEIKGNLKGADLSNSLIEGGIPGQDLRKCTSYITIKGNLNGTKFRNSTMRCVKLMNTSTSTNDGHQSYAGINFVGAIIDGVILENGNFTFSDFYKAEIKQLDIKKEASFKFSTLAELKCTEGSMHPGYCSINIESIFPMGQAREAGLSINVRDSNIISDLSPPKEGEWPALLCNKDSQWITKSKRHPAKVGELLVSIATNFNVPVENLKRVNPGITLENDWILAKEHNLLIPFLGGSGSDSNGDRDSEGARVWVTEENKKTTCRQLFKPPAPHNSGQTLPPDPGRR